MFYRIVKFLFSIFQNIRKVLSWSAIAFIVGVFVLLAIGKTYQNWDDDEDRGAIAIENGAFNESHSIPVYLDQGWDETDSLWFYNTTQGSAVLPYDFFLVLEEADSTERFRSNKIIDRFRFLPQKPTFFNPDGLPVGFAKDDYQGKDYMGFTCAACHTSQVNVKVPGEEMLKAIRIDGGPSMADMDGFMKALEKAMKAAQSGEKGQQFVTNVLALKNDYGSKKEVIADLDKWTARRNLYNTFNRSRVKYGTASPISSRTSPSERKRLPRTSTRATWSRGLAMM